MLSAVIDLLSPHFETVLTRQALLKQALGVRSPLLKEISYEGNPHDFLINTLALLSREQDTLDALLDVVIDRVGESQARKFEAIRPILHDWVAKGAPRDAFESKSSLRAETTRSILISYSRRDRDAVLKLYADLKSLGFTLWRDLHDIQGGEPFWEEIKKGIDACESVVLCMSPESLNSQFVQAEWQYARQQGKRVVPVMVADVDFATVPRWMSRLDWKDFREGRPERETVWASFIRTLNTPYSGHKVPFMVQTLPPYFVQRPTEFDALVNALVDQHGAVAITAAVKGAGGFGKTTLAMALCHDTRIKGAFDDGILWVTLGEVPNEADLLKQVEYLIYALTGEKPPINDRINAKVELTKAMADRYILLVIDDLWRKADADLFLTGGKNSATLITTRLDAQLPDDTRFKQTVDAMRLEQAMKLLTWSIEGVQTTHQSALQNLAQRLGEWAVLLRLVNGTLRKRIQSGESLTKALDYAAQALTRKGLNAFSSSNPQARNEAVHSTLKVSLDLLTTDQQTQFARLAIFPEDVDIPFTTLEKVWQRDDFDTEAIAIALNEAGLLLNFELEQCTIRLHDVVRHYLIDEHRTQTRLWQADFIAALNGLHDLPDEYVWRNISYHLREANQVDTLRTLLLDFGWLQAKLNATDVNALLADYVGLTADDPLRLVESAISMSAHVIGQDKTQIALQVYGRLLGYKTTQHSLAPLLQVASAQQGSLQILHPTLSQAGGTLISTIPLENTGNALVLTEDGKYLLVADGAQVKVFLWRTGTLISTFVKHTSSVTSLNVMEEVAFSTSWDNTVKVWRWATGELITNFTQHRHGVNSVNVQGKLAFSASNDGTVKVWRWATGELITDFTQHRHGVNSVNVQGKLAFSASNDGTVKVWRWATGELITDFTQHRSSVNRVSVVGEVAFSASNDRTVKVWRWATGEVITDFTQHTDDITSVNIVGEVAFSASRDGTVKVWRWATGDMITNFTQHRSYVSSMSVVGEVVFSASYQTVKVWRWATGEVITNFSQHTDNVISVSVVGEVAFSVSRDKTVKVWQWAKDKVLTDFSLHRHAVTSTSIVGKVAFSASYGTVKVWRWATGEVLTDFTQHRYAVTSMSVVGKVVFSADSGGVKVWQWATGEVITNFWQQSGSVNSMIIIGKVAFSASYGRVKVWHWATGKVITDFTQHTNNVTSVSVVGEVAFSASHDKTVKVWRWATGEVITDFTQHIDWVNSMSVVGEVAFSASSDRRVKVWRWATGEVITDFSKHTKWVNSVSVVGEIALSASGDGTVKVWRWATGEVITDFMQHTAQVTSVVVQGALAFSASDDKTVRVWRWATGEVVATFTADAPLACLAFEQEHHILLAGDTQGHIHVLRIVGLDHLLFPGEVPPPFSLP